MNAILFEESITLEFSQLFEECDKSIAYATARLMEEGITPSYITEASNGRTGGLVGFIGTVLKAIKDLIGDSYKKIKSMIFGSKVDESNTNTPIEGIRNPDGLADIVNGTIKDGKSFLAKASRGEISVDAAKKWSGEVKAKLGTVAETSIGAAALFGLTKVAQNKMESWKKEIDDAYQMNSESMHNMAEQISRTKGGMTEEQFKEVIQIILNTMRDASGQGISGIEGSLKKLYASKYLKEKIGKDVDVLVDPKARKEAEKAAVKSTKDTTKQIKELEQRDKNIKDGQKVQSAIDSSNDYNKARLAEAEKKVYNNADNYVDEDDLNKPSFVRKDSKKTERKIRRENNFKKLKNAGSSVLTRNDKRINIKK